MIRNSMEKFIFIDTETGGIDPSKHSLLSIGMVAWSAEDGILGSLELFIKHDNYDITKEAILINGFNLDVHNSISLSPKEVIGKIVEFKETYFSRNELPTLIGHNIQFDTNFLKVFLIKNNRSFNPLFSHRMIDTNSILKYLIISGKIPKEIKNLSDAIRFFNIKIKNRHSALDDCLATVSLFESMIGLITQNNSNDFKYTK